MQSAIDRSPPGPAARSGHDDSPSADQDAGGLPLEREQLGQVARLFQTTSDLLATITPDGRFTLLNPAWEEALGWSRESLLERPLRELVHPDDAGQTAAMLLAGRERAAEIANFTNRYRHRDGSWRWLLWSARSDGRTWYAAAKDVSERIWLERQALHDPLTKLPNRLLLMDRALQALTRLHRSHGLVALLFIDLDRFKAVNDNLGHALGDRLLISLAQRLAGVMRDSDTIARLGGDEFVILVEELQSDAEALAVAERVLHALQEPFVVGSTEVSMLASVGVSVSHDPDADPEALLREADVAMYRAKRAGGYRLELFDEQLRREAAAHLDIERRLRDALPRQELSLDYQPIFALQGGHVVACEALLRWRPREGEPVPPAQFLARAQESGLIVQIGEWALDAACRQVALWRDAGAGVAVSVNVSARGLTELDLAERLQAALARHSLAPEALWIELTEGSVLTDPERVRSTLAQVRGCGVRVALDRAGAEETRLALIGSLPLDVLKLDRTLIADCERDPRTRAVALALVELARAVGVETVAVGVQSESQLQLVRELGCTHAQGFLLGEPQPAERVALQAPGAVGSLARWGPPARLNRRP
jgi:diguanylate cyclase (GGDEF)-like protein/PAS domain S-box-containing protein